MKILNDDYLNLNKFIESINLGDHNIILHVQLLYYIQPKIQRDAKKYMSKVVGLYLVHWYAIYEQCQMYQNQFHYFTRYVVCTTLSSGYQVVDKSNFNFYDDPQRQADFPIPKIKDNFIHLKLMEWIFYRYVFLFQNQLGHDFRKTILGISLTSKLYMHIQYMYAVPDILTLFNHYIIACPSISMLNTALKLTIAGSNVNASFIQLSGSILDKANQVSLDMGSSTYIIAINCQNAFKNPLEYKLFNILGQSVIDKVDSCAFASMNIKEKSTDYDLINFGQPPKGLENHYSLFVNWKNVFFDATSSIQYPIHPIIQSINNVSQIRISCLYEAFFYKVINLFFKVIPSNNNIRCHCFTLLIPSLDQLSHLSFLQTCFKEAIQQWVSKNYYKGILRNQQTIFLNFKREAIAAICAAILLRSKQQNNENYTFNNYLLADLGGFTSDLAKLSISQQGIQIDHKAISIAGNNIDQQRMQLVTQYFQDLMIQNYFNLFNKLKEIKENENEQIAQNLENKMIIKDKDLFYSNYELSIFTIQMIIKGMYQIQYYLCKNDYTTSQKIANAIHFYVKLNMEGQADVIEDYCYQKFDKLLQIDNQQLDLQRCSQKQINQWVFKNLKQSVIDQTLVGWLENNKNYTANQTYINHKRYIDDAVSQKDFFLYQDEIKNQQDLEIINKNINKNQFQISNKLKQFNVIWQQLESIIQILITVNWMLGQNEYQEYFKKGCILDFTISQKIQEFKKCYDKNDPLKPFYIFQDNFAFKNILFDQVLQIANEIVSKIKDSIPKQNYNNRITALQKQILGIKTKQLEIIPKTIREDINTYEELFVSKLNEEFKKQQIKYQLIKIELALVGLKDLNKQLYDYNCFLTFLEIQYMKPKITYLEQFYQHVYNKAVYLENTDFVAFVSNSKKQFVNYSTISSYIQKTRFKNIDNYENYSNFTKSLQKCDDDESLFQDFQKLCQYYQNYKEIIANTKAIELMYLNNKNKDEPSKIGNFQYQEQIYNSILSQKQNKSCKTFKNVMEKEFNISLFEKIVFDIKLPSIDGILATDKPQIIQSIEINRDYISLTFSQQILNQTAQGVVKQIISEMKTFQGSVENQYIFSGGFQKHYLFTSYIKQNNIKSFKQLDAYELVIGGFETENALKYNQRLQQQLPTQYNSKTIDNEIKFLTLQPDEIQQNRLCIYIGDSIQATYSFAGQKFIQFLSSSSNKLINSNDCGIKINQNFFAEFENSKNIVIHQLGKIIQLFKLNCDNNSALLFDNKIQKLKIKNSNYVLNLDWIQIFYKCLEPEFPSYPIVFINHNNLEYRLPVSYLFILVLQYCASNYIQQMKMNNCDLNQSLITILIPCCASLRHSTFLRQCCKFAGINQNISFNYEPVSAISYVFYTQYYQELITEMNQLQTGQYIVINTNQYRTEMVLTSIDIQDNPFYFIDDEKEKKIDSNKIQFPYPNVKTIAYQYCDIGRNDIITIFLKDKQLDDLQIDDSQISKMNVLLDSQCESDFIYINNIMISRIEMQPYIDSAITKILYQLQKFSEKCLKRGLIKQNITLLLVGSFADDKKLSDCFKQQRNFNIIQIPKQVQLESVMCGSVFLMEERNNIDLSSGEVLCLGDE